MSRPATKTPPDLPIPLRDLQFIRGSAGHGRWWHGGDPVPSAFFNALSCTFPAGEKFFMDSVRAFRRDVDPALQAQIKGFIAQEAVHSREHAAFNKLAADHGYNVARLEDRTRRVLGRARRRTREQQLAATCALEHFTAMLAHELLANDSRDMAAAPDEIARLWGWHAVEEIEHKAVAFDTFLTVTAHWPAPRRYAARTIMMIVATVILYSTIAANMRDLYRQDGLRGFAVWGRTVRYLFGRQGILRRITPAWLGYFKPGFHPWQHDDRALLAKAEARLGLTVATSGPVAVAVAA